SYKSLIIFCRHEQVNAFPGRHNKISVAIVIDVLPFLWLKHKNSIFSLPVKFNRPQLNKMIIFSLKFLIAFLFKENSSINFFLADLISTIESDFNSWTGSPIGDSEGSKQERESLIKREARGYKKELGLETTTAEDKLRDIFASSFF